MVGGYLSSLQFEVMKRTAMNNLVCEFYYMCTSNSLGQTSRRGIVGLEGMRKLNIPSTKRIVRFILPPAGNEVSWNPDLHPQWHCHMLKGILHW